MMRRSSPIWLLQTTLGLTLLNSVPVDAQIVSDQTLPNNSIVTTLNGDTIQIDGGTKAGNNLFHSFREFSVPANNTAAFNNTLEIQNIFSRVTGSSISNIDGIIKANGTANLFLINPNGIMFGPNAALNIGGSFIASTANRVIFSDGFEFSATNPQATPLLTVNVPIGLGFGASPGQITNQSQTIGNKPSFVGEIVSEIVGLQVEKDKTLALVGGQIALQGGNLTANAGRIEIGSVAGGDTVSLTPIEWGWQLGYEGVQAFQDISLSSGAKVDTSGNTGGAIHLQGRQLEVLDGSSILTRTFGTGQSGRLMIDTAESVLVSGRDSLLTTEAMFGSSGNAEAINITTERLIVEELGTISTGTVGTGDAGAITLNVDDLIVQDRGLIRADSNFEGKGGTITINALNTIELLDDGGFVSSFSVDEGKGGNIVINTNRLNMSGEFTITTSANGLGKAGDITVTASNVSLGERSRISVQTTSAGNGGNITLNTENLTMSDGGIILADTTDASIGRGGTITINATESVKAIGSFTLNGITTPSGVFTETRGRGDAGDIVLNTDGKLTVAGGAAISASTSNTGNAGKINLNVGQLLMQDGGDITSGSLLRSLLDPGLDNILSSQRGAGGTITINATDSVDITGASRLFTLSEGTGDAGSIFINTDNLNVTDASQINARTEDIGRAGNIDVTASNISVGKDASISAQTAGAGVAGNVSLNTGILTISDGGMIVADTTNTGQGGTITIKATNLINISDGTLSTEAQGTGKAGNLIINTNNLNITDGAQITASTLGLGEAGSIDVTASTFSINNGGQLRTTTSGVERAGNIFIYSDNLTLNGLGSGILADTEIGSSGDGGSIFLNFRNTNINDSATISVNSQGTGIGGEITLRGGRLTLNNQASLSATTLSTDGGNITLNLNDRLLLRNGSNISATAGLAGGGGDGGNISIDSPFIIAVLEEDSDITANAFEGSGGNINITTQGIFGIQPQPELTPRSDITASSEFGIQGTVNIINPDTNLVNRLVEFPENPVDVSQLVAQDVCTVEGARVSSLVIKGKGGLPSNPGDPVTPDDNVDWATRSQQEKKPPVILKGRSQHQQPTIQQVQGWRREADGTIILTADATVVTPRIPVFNAPGCR